VGGATLTSCLGQLLRLKHPVLAHDLGYYATEVCPSAQRQGVCMCVHVRVLICECLCLYVCVCVYESVVRSVCVYASLCVCGIAPWLTLKAGVCVLGLGHRRWCTTTVLLLRTIQQRWPLWPSVKALRPWTDPFSCPTRSRCVCGGQLGVCVLV
jgi:hypothetical protein